MCQKIVSYDRAPLVVEYFSLPPSHTPPLRKRMYYTYREKIYTIQNVKKFRIV